MDGTKPKMSNFAGSTVAQVAGLKFPPGSDTERVPDSKRFSLNNLVLS